MAEPKKRRGRPPKSETTTVANVTQAPEKKPRGRTAAKPSTIGLSQAELNKLKKEIKEEILNSREFTRMKKEILDEAKKEVLRSVVNPLVAEFRKIDK